MADQEILKGGDARRQCINTCAFAINDDELAIHVLYEKRQLAKKLLRPKVDAAPLPHSFQSATEYTASFYFFITFTKFNRQ